MEEEKEEEQKEEEEEEGEFPPTSFLLRPECFGNLHFQAPLSPREGFSSTKEKWKEPLGTTLGTVKYFPPPPPPLPKRWKWGEGPACVKTTTASQLPYLLIQPRNRQAWPRPKRSRSPVCSPYPPPSLPFSSSSSSNSACGAQTPKLKSSRS